MYTNGMTGYHRIGVTNINFHLRKLHTHTTRDQVNYQISWHIQSGGMNDEQHIVILERQECNGGAQCLPLSAFA